MSSTTQSVGTAGGLPTIQASLNYLLKTEEKPVAYAYTPPPGIPQTILHAGKNCAFAKS